MEKGQRVEYHLVPPLLAVANFNAVGAEVYQTIKPKLELQSISICKGPIKNRQAVMENTIVFHNGWSAIYSGHC